jgi:hypothetical protein
MGDTLLSTRLNPLFVFPTTGSYEILLVAYGPCGTDTARVQIDLILQSLDQWPYGAISLRPNPMEQFTDIEFPESRVWEMQVIDLTGKVIWQGEVNGRNYRLDRKEWAAGVYQLVVSDSRRRKVVKLVVN